MLDQALLFAHRGGRTATRAHALDAVDHALGQGATGLHVDVWSTRDGQPVVSRDGRIRRFPRRHVASVDAADLPEPFVTLEALYARIGSDADVSVRVGDVATGSAVMGIARDHDAEASLWLCHHDLEVLARWRDATSAVKLVNVARLDGLPLGPERRAAELAAARVDAVSMPEPDWSGGLSTLFHRFEVLTFATEAHYERQIARVIDLGIDAVVGDQVERMAAVAATFA